VQVIRELPSLRTAASDTFLESDGSRLARIYAAPVNYRAANGEWVPIDDGLQRGLAGWQPAASPVPVNLPSSLASGAVSLGAADSSVSFSLEGASGEEGLNAGAQMTYANAEPGVSVSYAVSSQAVRETLSLANAAVATVYRYRLAYAPGLRPELTGSGGVAIKDISGKVAYTMAAPTVTDSSPGAQLPSTAPVHYELSGDGSQLTLVLDKSWLQDPRRVFPVQVDPDIYFSEQSDCTIASANNANTNLCGGPLYVGVNTETPKGVLRSMLQFNLASIPRDANILYSRLGLWFKTDTTTSPVEIEANGLTRSFTQAATWNKYDGTSSWSTPGGDFSATMSGKQTILDSYKNYWVNWGFTPLVQQWVQEPGTNHGVILKARNETVSGYDEFLRVNNSEKTGEPSMEINYVPRTGINEGDIVLGDELAAGGEVAVNAANGNLIVTSPDVNYQGEGYETHLTRYYNSKDENIVGPSFGPSWQLSTGNNTLLYPTWWDRSYHFHEPGGGWTRFDPTPPASSLENQAQLKYVAQPGLNASLVAHEDGTRTVIFNESGTEWQFDKSENGFPQKIVEPEGLGNTISLGYTESRLTHVSDTHGHELTLTLATSPHHVLKIQNVNGEHWEYGYNASNQLTSYKDNEGHETKYGYATTGSVNEIADTRGTYVVTYDTKGRVTALRKLVNGTVKEAGTEDEIASYEYKPPESSTCNLATDTAETIVTYKPTGAPATFCFDASDHFTGPKSEAEIEAEGTETPEEVPPGTCYAKSEGPTEDCAVEEELPEDPEHLEKVNYGLSDNNYIALEEPTEQQKKEGEKAHPFFDYFASPYFAPLSVKKVRRVLPWNLVAEAQHDEEDPKFNPGAKRELEDVEKWISLVKASGAEPYVSFDAECGFKTETTELTPWDDPRKTLSPAEEEHDDYNCSQLPTEAQYQAAVEDFLKPVHTVLGEVRNFTALNEPNNAIAVEAIVKGVRTGVTTHRKATYNNGKRAGEYWRALHDFCDKKRREAEKRPLCNVAAGEFADGAMPDAWFKKLRNGNPNPGFTYFHAYVSGMGNFEGAHRWAWHSYHEGEETQPPSFKTNPKKWWAGYTYFEKAVNWEERNNKCAPCKTPNIWLTEQGVVYFENGAEKTPAEVWRHPKEAEAVMNAYVKHGSAQLTRKSNQILRFFYYSMRGAPSFDSGLLEAEELPLGAEATKKELKEPIPAPSTPREIYRIYKQKPNGM
jgi:YD repeat-containing protein